MCSTIIKGHIVILHGQLFVLVCHHEPISKIIESIIIIHHVIINQIIVVLSCYLVKVVVEFLKALVSVIWVHQILKLSLWDSSVCSVNLLNAHLMASVWTSAAVESTSWWDIWYVVVVLVKFIAVLSILLLVLFGLKLLLVPLLALLRRWLDGLLCASFLHAASNT